jgi:hypothetical protein
MNILKAELQSKNFYDIRFILGTNLVLDLFTWQLTSYFLGIFAIHIIIKKWVDSDFNVETENQEKKKIQL